MILKLINNFNTYIIKVYYIYKSLIQDPRQPDENARFGLEDPRLAARAFELTGMSRNTKQGVLINAPNG